MGAGAAVPQVLFRLQPGAQMAQPRLSVRAMRAAVRHRHRRPVRYVAGRRRRFRQLFRQRRLLFRDVLHHGARHDADRVSGRPAEHPCHGHPPLGLLPLLGQYPGHYLPAVHVLLGRAFSTVLLPALSEAAASGGVVYAASAFLLHRRHLLRRFHNRLRVLAPSRHADPPPRK